MSASKHTIYLTKTKKLDAMSLEHTNAFLFNENGKGITAKWFRKNIELNTGSFVILDHNNVIKKEVERTLVKSRYYIESVDLGNMQGGLSINPFDLVSDSSEIHYLFLNFLHALWDNDDPDIPAMSNLIDAFANCVYAMFSNQKEKLNIPTLKKMVASVRATCKTAEGTVMLTDAIFAGIKDQESMPCKYYNQFIKAAGNRKEEIAEKVAQVFDALTENDMFMMEETDAQLYDTFNFKTAIFVNVDDESQEASAKILITLLNYFIQKATNRKHVMFIIDNLDPNRNLLNLPYWMKEAEKYEMSFIVACDNLASFSSNPRAERFFRNFKKALTASVLVHHNDDLAKGNETSLDELDSLMGQYCIATVLIPSEEVSEQDELL